MSLSGSGNMMSQAHSVRMRRTEEFFQKIYRQAATGIAITDWRGVFQECNPAYSALLGYTEEELRTIDFASLIHPEDREANLVLVRRLQTGEIPSFEIENRYIHKNGGPVWVHKFGSVLQSEEGEPTYLIALVTNVTERKLAGEVRLRHAAIVESSDDAIIGTDPSGTVTDWNKGAERLFGHLASEAIGKSISFLRAPDRSEEGQANLKKVINGDVVKPYETVLQRKDGTLVDVSLRISPIVDSEGRIVGAAGISRDITERKQSEKALRESEERFRGLYENSTLGLYRTTSDGKILLANPSLVKMLGFSSFSELAQRNLEEKGFEPGYERAEFKRRLATEGEVKGLEASWARKDGTAIFVRESAKVIRDAEGKIAYYEGTVEDITERKQAEEALRQSEEKFLRAFRGSPVAITLSRVKDRRFIEVNDTFERLTGYRREEVIGSTAFDIGLWVDPSEREELTERLLSERSLRDLELRFRMKNGSVLTCSVSAELIEVGKELCILSVASDITQRKLAEEAMRKSEEQFRASEERLRLAQKVARIGSFEWNMQTGVNIWTPELEAMYGLAPGSFGKTEAAFENLVHPDDRGRVFEWVDEALKTGRPNSGEWRVIWPDGSVHWIAGRWQAFMNEAGEAIRMIGVNIDVTDQKRAQEEISGMTRKLVEAQEQERSRIARELHDDINQRVGVLAIELDQLRLGHELPKEVRSRVLKMLQMASEIASDLHAVSYELHSTKLDRLGVVRATTGWCKEFGDRHKLKISFESQHVPKLSQEISICLFRVLQEAVHNAAKHSGAKRIAVRLVENSGEIHLIVSDSGRGFDIEAAGQSQGLGLTSMRERVRLVGGTIAIESKLRGGTTIDVRIPLESEHRSQRAAV